ncbi:MAG: hypothetical protein PHS49_00245 [Candidatus Gracilibacteria bacterium]|nr:hypothetical protein [Candidatus Gracilibacteria bacterium]
MKKLLVVFVMLFLASCGASEETTPVVEQDINVEAPVMDETLEETNVETPAMEDTTIEVTTETPAMEETVVDPAMEAPVMDTTVNEIAPQ